MPKIPLPPTDARKAKAKPEQLATVDITISGSGYRATLYFINDNIFNKLKSARIEDALYEDNPISLVGNIALHSELICLGMDLSDSTLKANMTVGKTSFDIERVGYLPEDVEFEDEFSCSRDECLIAYANNQEMLGITAAGKLALNKGTMFVLEVAEYKLGTLRTRFQAPQSVKPSDIQIGFIDVDDPKSICTKVTYGLGMLNGVEQDIRYAIWSEIKNEFELDILNGYSSNFYLIRKDKQGEWHSEFLKADEFDEV